MYLVRFVLQQTLNWRLDKEKEVHGASVHLLMIDRLFFSSYLLNVTFYLQLAKVEGLEILSS